MRKMMGRKASGAKRPTEVAALIAAGRKFQVQLYRLADSWLLGFLSALPFEFHHRSFERSKDLLCFSHDLCGRLSAIELLAAMRADGHSSSKSKHFSNREFDRALALQARHLHLLIKWISSLLRHIEPDHTNKSRRAANGRGPRAR
jgi:hypothetical protein